MATRRRTGFADWSVAGESRTVGRHCGCIATIAARRTRTLSCQHDSPNATRRARERPTANREETFLRQPSLPGARRAKCAGKKRMVGRIASRASQLAQDYQVEADHG